MRSVQPGSTRELPVHLSRFGRPWTSTAASKSTLSTGHSTVGVCAGQTQRADVDPSQQARAAKLEFKFTRGTLCLAAAWNRSRRKATAEKIERALRQVEFTNHL